MSDAYVPPARTAHGIHYWLWVGWWWAPLKWLGRVSLWLIMWPLGLWRSWANSRAKRDARVRRGHKRAQRRG